MVNFRFHLVSLTAVFLALAAGIAIGAGVVDRQTVDFLEDRLRTVENNRQQTNAENDRLRGDIDVWRRFGEQAGDGLIQGRLQEIPVLLVGVDGTERELVERLRTSMQAAGAAVQGSVWLTGRWSLSNSDDVQRLAEVTGASATTRPNDLRSLALGQLVSGWSGGTLDALLALRAAGFVEYDPPPGEPLAIEQVRFAESTIAIVGSAAATTPSTDLVVPFAAALIGADMKVLATEPSVVVDAEGSDDDTPPPVGAALALRQRNDLAGVVSTVDNIGEFRGRMAAVLAVAALQEERTGHFGTGEGAQRLLPEPGA